MKHYLTLIALLFISISTHSQVYLEGKTKPTSADMSMSAAANKAKAFLQLLALDPGNPAKYFARFTVRFGVAGRKQWEFETTVATIKMDSISGMITSFVDRRRQNDRYRGHGRTGKKFTTSESVAQARLRQLATKLGVPNTSEMVNFSMKGDGVGNNSNPMGYFGCVFKDSNGRIFATVACDLQDGALLEFTRR